MEDEAIGLTARAGPVGIVEAAGIDGSYGADTFGDAAGRIALFIHVLSRRDLYAVRIRDFQQESLETAGIDILQSQCRIGTGFEFKQFLFRRRADAAQDLVDFFLRKEPGNVLGMTALEDGPDDGALQVVERSEEDDKRRCQGEENGDKDKKLTDFFYVFPHK